MTTDQTRDSTGSTGSHETHGSLEPVASTEPTAELPVLDPLDQVEEPTPDTDPGRVEEPFWDAMPDATSASMDAPMDLPAASPVAQVQTAATPTPEWIAGPAAGPIVIGVIGLLAMVLGLLVASDRTIDWAVAGPASVIGLGAVIITLGVLGLRRNRA